LLVLSRRSRPIADKRLFARLRRLTRHDWSLLLTAWLRLLLVDLELRVFGFERTARLARPLSGNEPSLHRVERARTYSRWLSRASKYHAVNARCLHRSLALHQWLRAEGTPSTLEIGVALDEGQLRAHAWVHVGNSLVGDSQADVAPFARLGAAGATPWR
jgi:hypothetical protein